MARRRVKDLCVRDIVSSGARDELRSNVLVQLNSERMKVCMPKEPYKRAL